MKERRRAGSTEQQYTRAIVGTPESAQDCRVHCSVSLSTNRVSSFFWSATQKNGSKYWNDDEAWSLKERKKALCLLMISLNANENASFNV